MKVTTIIIVESDNEGEGPCYMRHEQVINADKSRTLSAIKATTKSAIDFYSKSLNDQVEL